MRIGIDARHLTGGNGSGVDHYTLALLREAVLLFPEHTFVLLTTGSAKAHTQALHLLKDLLTSHNVLHRHIPIPNRVLNFLIAFVRHPTLDRMFRESVDVIWCPNINFIAPGHTPIILTVHDLSFELFKKLYNAKRLLWHRIVRPRLLARRASALIAPSKTTAEDLAHGYGIERGRVHVIPHGVSERFSPTPRPEDHGVRSRYGLPRHYVLHVGTHEPRKNLPFLVEGFLESLKRSPDLRALEMKLVLAGAPLDVPLPRSPHIRLLGYVPDAHLPALYRLADVFAFPSLYEGFGMPILEAFASGVPVITSHTSAMLEVGGDAALFVDPENNEDITQGIIALIENEPLRAHLTMRGLTRAEAYRWDRTARETVGLLAEVSHASFIPRVPSARDDFLLQ